MAGVVQPGSDANVIDQAGANYYPNSKGGPVDDTAQKDLMTEPALRISQVMQTAMIVMQTMMITLKLEIYSA